MRRFLLFFVLGLFLVLSAYGTRNALAQGSGDQVGETLLTDQNTTPAQFHQMLAEMKQARLNKLREVEMRVQTKGTPAQSYYDARYYRLDLKLNNTTEIISGSVYMYAEALIDGFNVVELNFFDNPEMYIDSVTSNGASAYHTWNNDIIRVFLNGTYNTNETFGVTVYYHGHPLEGGLQSFDWGYHGSPAMPIMSTLSEPYFAQAWWPCKDLPRDKADSVDININVRSDVYVASNGVLREILDYGSTKTYKWHEGYPITTYLVSIAATNFTIFSNWYHPIRGDSMEVIYYVYPERYDQAAALWPITPSMIEVFANTFGEYPFVEEKYGMAHFTWGGAMEHQTNTSFSSSWYSEWVIAHELAHQWWGDYITVHNWHHIWLNEGFASWSEALWAESLGGLSSYHSYMNGMQHWGGGTIFVEDTTDAWNIFASIVYDKGAWVVHMLRGVVGDEHFFQILRNYYSDPRFAHGSADTEGFQDVCETTSGMDLDYFFQEWIYGEYYPKYRYSYTWEPAGGGYSNVYVHLDQTQTTNPTHFTMPVRINVGTYSGDTTVVLFNDPGRKDIGVRLLGTSGVNVSVDPDRWILRSVSSGSYGMNIVTTDLPSAPLASAYAETLLAKGGVAPYVWELESGSLPNGMGLDSLTGVISGTPSVQDSFHFTAKATDSSAPNKTDTQELYILVTEVAYMNGDANHDLVIDVGDVIYIVGYLYDGGPDPLPLESADVNCDGIINVGDVVYLINYLFKGGPPPC
ncbi:MAG: putative Ig domain-containing protein [Candidatus Zixiibacteriota bacterium]|nr:MAG: putative Ig domain-containing protein [candidate division Zixibacteria bacterium]